MCVKVCVQFILLNDLNIEEITLEPSQNVYGGMMGACQKLIKCGCVYTVHQHI